MIILQSSLVLSVVHTTLVYRPGRSQFGSNPVGAEMLLSSNDREVGDGALWAHLVCAYNEAVSATQRSFGQDDTERWAELL